MFKGNLCHESRRPVKKMEKKKKETWEKQIMQEDET